MKQVVTNNQITEIKNGDKTEQTIIEIQATEWKRRKITDNLRHNFHKVQLDENSKWIKHDNRNWPLIQNENSLSPVSSKINSPFD